MLYFEIFWVSEIIYVDLLIAREYNVASEYLVYWICLRISQLQTGRLTNKGGH